MSTKLVVQVYLFNPRNVRSFWNKNAVEQAFRQYFPVTEGGISIELSVAIQTKVKDFKDSLLTQMSSAGVLGKDGGSQAYTDFMSSIPESEETDEKLLGKKTKMKKPIGKLYSIGKTENKEATGAGAGVGIYDTPLFSTTKGEMREKWSQKYKNSIDCKNPKGFSQRAHCQGKKKQTNEDFNKEGKSEKSLDDLVKKYKKIKDEWKKIKREVKKPTEKDAPKKTETKEATGSSLSGQYATPAAWAKSTSKKDWRGKSKTQIPGGKFVQVKKKCKKFPYCNQGDINALKIFDHVDIKKVISDVSKSYGISESMVRNIISYEYNRYKSKQ